MHTAEKSGAAKSGVATEEREALAHLLAELGPNQPTLCAGWTTYDMAAHLVTRDRRPDALPGLVLPLLHGYTARLEAQRRDSTPYDVLVEQLRAGSPLLPVPLPPLDDLANVHEYFVHHEDVRRANGGEPRPADPARDAALWQRLRLGGRALFRRCGDLRVVLERPDGERLVVHRGAGEVVVRGPVDELFLLAFGRGDAARVEVSGDPSDVELFRSAAVGV